MSEFQLHPESQKVVEYLKSNAPLPNSALSLVEQARKSSAKRNIELNGGDGNYPFKGERKEIIIPALPNVKDGAPVPVFVYVPHSVKKDPVIFVYAHGGGMTLGTRYNQDSSCKIVSESAGCICVNIEYRLAPEHKFPASIEDTTAVMEWVKKNKTELGGSAHSKVGLGGDSAGGTITASVTHDIPMDFQVLIYPHVTKAKDYSLQSFKTYKDGPLLSIDYIKWFENNYVPAGEEENPRLASILRSRFDHLPPALMLIAEHDPLKDGSYLYADKLKENNVPVEVVEFKGAIHAFYGQTICCPTLCKEAYDKVSSFIKKIHESKKLCVN